MKSREFKKDVEEMKAKGTELPSKIQMISISMNQEMPLNLIIDCSMFSYIDSSGISTLRKTIRLFEDIGIKTVLAGAHVHVEGLFGKEGFFEDISSDQLYISVHDAVTYLLDEANDSGNTSLDLHDYNDQNLSN